MLGGLATADPAKPVTKAWPATAALSALVASIVGFLVWQYLMPAGFESSFLLDHAGVAHFRDALHLRHVEVGVAPYRAGFRVFLALMWTAYFVTVMAGAFGSGLPQRRTLLLIVTTIALVAAVAWPPSFSCDVYGYVGYARMKVLYALNPYSTTQQTLIALHDPTGPFLRWNIASPYGPLWTSLSIAVVWLMPGAGLYAQVVVMKLIAAAALVVAAWKGAHVAERLAPGRGALTLAAIGLNPLFVIEGPGNGHNDLVMMALVVVALGAFFDGRTLRAVAWAGVAAAVKFLPLFLVPWMVLYTWRDRPTSLRRRARDLVLYGAAATLPIVIGYWPYWLGAGTMRGLAQRWTSGQTSSSTEHHLWTEAISFVLIYGAATWWALRGERARLLTAWVIATAAVYLVTTGIWLPWYLSWIWLASLLAWDRRTATFSYLSFCFAVVLTVRYSVP